MRLLGSVGIRLSKALKSGLQVGVGFVALVCGLFFVTNLTLAFTKAIAAAKCDGIAVPADFEGGAALDFASAFWCFVIYHLTVTLKWSGAVGAGLLAAGMCAVNYVRSRKSQLQNFVSNVDATSSSRQNKDVFHLFRRDEDVASTLQLPQKACLTAIGKAVFHPVLKRQDCRFPVGRRSSIQGLAVSSNFVSRILGSRKPNCKASQPSTPLGLTGAGATGILPVAVGTVVWP